RFRISRVRAAPDAGILRGGSNQMRNRPFVPSRYRLTESIGEVGSCSNNEQNESGSHNLNAEADNNAG
ncbi:MAG TPA: hypothetical protein VK419_07610, partial [Bryobacteraceae bacterium]|nr:hypothetical protein [Bryobacteraceae bacterium]